MRPQSPVDAANDVLDLPDAFCWTKYGTEAGEGIAAIVSRKEIERRRNGGVFLWGIGNAIGPSLAELIRANPHPNVVFTPMLSHAAAQDANPPALGVWHQAIGLDGHPVSLPRHSLVTSRIKESGRSRPHFALVCRHTHSLTDWWDPPGATRRLSLSQVVNFRSGSRVGSSQVTSVVRKVAANPRPTETPYRVALVAELVPPYLVRLTACVRVPDALRTSSHLAQGDPQNAFDALLPLRPDWRTAQDPEQSELSLPGLGMEGLLRQPRTDQSS